MTSQKPMLECSFCGKRQDQVKKLIAGKNVFICDECISLCHSIIEHDEKPQEKSEPPIPSPREIREFLDQYVIGQDYAKVVMSVAVHNHYKRLASPIIDDVEIDKTNLVLLGPTGSGKTLLAQSIARMLNVPFAMADATTLTEAGYVGDDVESIIARLLQVADYDVERAQRGIVFIDELDKKRIKSEGSSSITRDVSGEGVQQALLKIIEGTECRVPPQGGRKHPNQDMTTVNTRGILFIVGGAFVGLDEIVAARQGKQGSMGFGAALKVVNRRDDAETAALLQDVRPEDLVKYGLIPELVGRLPVVASLEELSEHQLVQVLTQPKNALAKQYMSLFRIEDVQLEFDNTALIEIAKQCKERHTGARGLRSVIEKLLIPVQYELPDLRHSGVTKVTINKEVVAGEKPPELWRNDERYEPAA